MQIKAAIFDVFGTVVDWRTGITEAVEVAYRRRGLLVDGAIFADEWRALYGPAMAPIIGGSRPYVALDQLHLENLQTLLASRNEIGLFSAEEEISLARAWERLPPWDDSVQGLRKLSASMPIAPCSNGSIALMTHLARYAALPWSCILGAELAQNYKPDASVYLTCCSALRLAPEEVVMVAAHNSDLHAAQNAGLRTAYIPRPLEHGTGADIDLKATGKWDFIARDLKHLAVLLG